MKKLSALLPTLALPVALLLVTAGFYAAAGWADDPVTLPLRVYPADGTSEHVESVTLNVENAAGIDRLYVQAHQPFYHRGGVEEGVEEGFDPEAAAAIRVNGGDWIDVRDENVTCAQPEEDFGCVAGIASTIRFAVPVSNVREGANTIAFRFNGTKGIRSGYRVLKLGLMRGGDDVQDFDPQTDGASETTFQHEDYSTWEAPEGYDDPGAAQAGEDLFQSEGILVNDAVSDEPIQASCSSCHAKDGRDLKYFNYSNRTLVARSRYHGLSAEEGKQIAAYIRSLRLEREDGSTYEAPGTPWDPPYQPGPELMATGEHPDASDPAFWAAGAGLDAVVENDADVLPYLFPDGQGGVDELPSGELDWRHLSADSSLNMRALPLSVQFPDWNNWLPDIHPLDVPTSDEQPAISHFDGPVQSAVASGDVEEILRLMKRFRMKRPGLSGKPAGWTSNDYELAAMSSYQWQAVRAWETYQGHHLENVADELYCDDPVRPFCEPRSWAGRQRFVFDIAPHIASTGGGVKGPPYGYADAAQDAMMSHLWYHLQVVINPGSQPASSAQTPVDWNYQYDFSKDAAVYGRPAALRYLSSYAKMWQMQSNEYGVDGNPDGSEPDRQNVVHGWGAFTTNPWRVMTVARRAYVRDSGIMANLSDPMIEKTLTAMLRAWNDYNSRFDIDAFPRDSDDTRWYNEATDTQEFGWTSTRDHSQQIYQNLHYVTDDMPGVARGVLDSIATWGAQMWPRTTNPAWDEIVDYDASANQAPSARITNLSDGLTFPAPANLTVEVDAHDTDGRVDHVTLLAGDTEVGTDASAPYRISWEDVPAGEYTLAARATDEQGKAGTSAPFTVTVQEGEPETTQAIRLRKGWNFISGRVEPRAPHLDSVFAEVPGLAVVRDEQGRTYQPDADENDLTEWSAREAYAVFMQAGATLQVHGSLVSCEATAIPLKKGWNYLPYLCEQPAAPAEALASIADALVSLKDGTGRIYAPDRGVSDIEQLRPGRGYKVYVTEDATLTYPSPAPSSVPSSAPSASSGRRAASESSR